MIRHASLLSSDTALLGLDPTRPHVVHLTGLHRAGRDAVSVVLPSALLGLRPDDDYLLDVESFRACFDETHQHYEQSADANTSTLPAPRSTFYQLDGSDDTQEEEEDHQQTKRQRRDLGGVARVKLEWTFSKPPFRLLETPKLDLLTPSKFLRLLNRHLKSIHMEEFLGLAFKEPPSFHLIPGSDRVVVRLPPLAVVHLVNLGQAPWQFLGFKNLSDTADTPFRTCENGDLALANFSPTKIRSFVSESAVKPHDSFLSSTGQLYSSADWQTMEPAFGSTGKIVLQRLNPVGETEFDFSSIVSLTMPQTSASGDTVAPPPPPLMAAGNIENLLSVACAGFGLENLVQLADKTLDARFTVDPAAFPRLRIVPLYSGVAAGRLKLTISIDERAAQLLGFLPAELASLSFDASSGYTSAQPSYARTNSYDDWSEATDGNPLRASQLSQFLITMLASDVTPPAAEAAERTANGLLAVARKEVYRALSSLDNFDESTFPQSLLQKISSAVADPNYEETATAYQSISRDTAARYWSTLQYNVDPVSGDVIPVVPEAWKEKILPPPTTTPPPPPPPPPPASQEQQQQQQQRRGLMKKKQKTALHHSLERPHLKPSKQLMTL